MYWMAVISGKVMRAVQSVAYPREAPAAEYVLIPDGSSSDAPVTTPGPSSLKKRRIGFRSQIGSDPGLSEPSGSDGPPDWGWPLAANFSGSASARGMISK